MMELCNAFKTRYRHELEQQKALGGATPRHPGMTPFGGGRTPAGGRTPGGTPFRPPGMGGSTPRPPGMGSTPMGMPHGHEAGGRTPMPMRPPGMGTPMSRPMGGGMTPRPPGFGSTPFGFAGPQSNCMSYPYCIHCFDADFCVRSRPRRTCNAEPLYVICLSRLRSDCSLTLWLSKDAPTPFGQHHQAIPPPVMAPPPPPPPGGSAFRPPASGGMNPERA